MVTDATSSGYCYFPEKPAYNDQYFKALTSETLESVFSGGKTTLRWKLVKGQRNEALDCRVYNTAALNFLNPDMATLPVNQLVVPAFGKTNVQQRRVLDKGKQGTEYRLEIMAYPDPTDMNPPHVSWNKNTTSWRGRSIDENMTNWLENGHGGMGVKYRAAKFIEKTEEEIDKPNGLLSGMRASLRKAGFKVFSAKGGEI
jgi:hypothetical protein